MLEKCRQQLLKMTRVSVPLKLNESLLAEDEKRKKPENYEI